MPINFYTPTFRQQTNPIDLNTLAKTYNTLEQGHQQAIQTKSQIDAQLAQLDLNEAEDGWRQEQLNKMRTALNENMQYGNAYSAIDDVVRTYGDISSNAGMIGRLRAQKDYKEYLTNLDKRQDLSEDKKNYFREVNQYNYSDVTDKNGNIIGGTKWNPTDHEVTEIPLSELTKQAIQITAKEAGGGNTIYYMGEDGKLTSDYSKSVDGLPYMNKGGKYEKLPKEKLKAALESIILTTPGAQASLDQDYKVANWKQDKLVKANGDKAVVGEVTDEKGIRLTPQQYLEKRLDGFYQSATYSRYYSNIEPLAGMSVQAAKARSITKQSGGGFNLGDFVNASINTTPGAYYINKSSAISSEVSKFKAATETLKGFADRNNIKFDISDVDGSYKRISDTYAANGGIVPKEIYDTYKEYKRSTTAYEQLIPPGAGEDFKKKLQFSTALENGVDLGMIKGNEYVNDYVTQINKLYGDSNEAKFYLNGDFGQTIKNIPNYKDLGLVIKTDGNGLNYLSLSKENANNLYLVAKELDGFVDGTDKNRLTGSDIPLTWSVNNSSSIGYNGAQTKRIFHTVNNLYSKTSKSVDDIINNEFENIPTEAVSQTDVIQTAAVSLVDSGKFSDLNSATKYVQDQLNSNVFNGAGERYNMAIGYEGKPANYNNTGAQRNAIMQIVRRVRAKDPELASISYDKNTLKTLINVTLTPTMMKDADIKEYAKTAGINGYNFNLVVDNMFNNESKNAIINSPQFKNNVEFTTAVNAGVKQFNNLDGSTLMTDGNGNYGIMDNGVVKPIDRNQAINVYKANKTYDDVVYYYNQQYKQYNGDIPTNVLNSMYSTIFNMVKSISPSDVNATDLNSLSPTGALKFREIINNIQNSTLD